MKVRWQEGEGLLEELCGKLGRAKGGARQAALLRLAREVFYPTGEPFDVRTVRRLFPAQGAGR